MRRNIICQTKENFVFHRSILNYATIEEFYTVIEDSSIFICWGF
jgi:hypothetical protein